MKSIQTIRSDLARIMHDRHAFSGPGFANKSPDFHRWMFEQVDAAMSYLAELTSDELETIQEFGKTATRFSPHASGIYEPSDRELARDLTVARSQPTSTPRTPKPTVEAIDIDL